MSGYTIMESPDLMSQTPLWLICGARDTEKQGTAGSVAASSRAIFKAITEVGGTRVKSTEYPKANHVRAIEMAADDPDILRWLLKQRR